MKKKIVLNSSVKVCIIFLFINFLKFQGKNSIIYLNKEEEHSTE